MGWYFLILLTVVFFLAGIAYGQADQLDWYRILSGARGEPDVVIGHRHVSTWLSPVLPRPVGERGPYPVSQQFRAELAVSRGSSPVARSGDSLPRPLPPVAASRRNRSRLQAYPWEE